MNTKKKVLIALIFLAVICIFLFIFKIYIWNRYFKHNIYYTEKTMIWENAEKIDFDEDYTVNVAIIVYKQLYGAEYSADDFIVDDDGIFGPLCWNVCLGPFSKPFNGIIDDMPKGLVIEKNNGAILINLGE